MARRDLPLQVTSSPDCPDPALFKRWVVVDLGQSPVVPVLAEVELRGTHKQFEGILRGEYEGGTFRRRLLGLNCFEVGRALAFVTALSLRAPEQLQGTGAEPAGKGDGDPRAKAERQANRPTTDPPLSTDGDAPLEPVPPSTAPASAAIDVKAAASTARPGPSWWLELSALGRQGPGPGIAPGAEGGLRRFLSQPDGGLWRPGSLALGLAASDGGFVAVSGGSARFRTLLARAEICPVALAPGGGGGRLTLHPACVSVEGGGIHSQGAEVAAPASALKPWLAGGLGARLLLPVGARFFLAASAGLSLPLTLHHFVFEDPRRPAHRVPPLSFQGGLGVGAALP